MTGSGKNGDALGVARDRVRQACAAGHYRDALEAIEAYREHVEQGRRSRIMQLATFKTKSFWVGVLMVAGGIVEGVFDQDWSAAWLKISGGIGLITVRDAVKKAER